MIRHYQHDLQKNPPPRTRPVPSLCTTENKALRGAHIYNPTCNATPKRTPCLETRPVSERASIKDTESSFSLSRHNKIKPNPLPSRPQIQTPNPGFQHKNPSRQITTRQNKSSRKNVIP